MNTRVKICKLGEVAPGEMKPVDVAGIKNPIAIFNLDGTHYATSNICTHNIAMLTDGYFEGDIVECPLHGGSFSIKTGEPMSFPCEIPLQTYPVTVEGDDVYIEAEVE
ncbi:MAG TPA: non-heme iron oxygenase ferredoxin subunit [Rugosibacter sp.]|nr:non-heme iron oxygenase ferredoxin subunit [Rugosibacter sp.]MDD3380949.1 non-heme iron oxygenase ferredoxin subunit [Rugosibacter sp.]HQN46955.1 non-heme iron oxygenase ferredoxin subunit [Rugosibacter sp.]HQQ35116.1 non-heme iron oxygenase ferredoxin subunit [Rugosibacter sp.]